MRMSIVAAKKLLGHLCVEYENNSAPHLDLKDLMEFLTQRIPQVERLSRAVKESIEVEVPPRYLPAIDSALS
ncbi:hypothetical protein Acj9p021 [Acinetobacter phage Acj9]|uniref:Uncharacterized protein n=1 Tax=Acinetobacter phage Acj9 TaxID=760939 RepID=E5EPF5_9CAUD|nr:hypothetical protein Acj9p021 [Acinetobacter phage Acj9]ADG59921.1 hypothetical protein Acj9p021 [Acinetobacter phage Acj9]